MRSAFVAGCLVWVTGLATALRFGRRVVAGTALRAVSFVAGLALVGFGAHFAIRAIREVL